MILVYCAGGNRRFAEIAVAHGYRYGAQLPETVYLPLWFADQDWRAPNRAAYMRALAAHRPALAAVLDWERAEWLPDAAAFRVHRVPVPRDRDCACLVSWRHN